MDGVQSAMANEVLSGEMAAGVYNAPAMHLICEFEARWYPTVHSNSRSLSLRRSTSRGKRPLDSRAMVTHAAEADRWRCRPSAFVFWPSRYESWPLVLDGLFVRPR